MSITNGDANINITIIACDHNNNLSFATGVDQNDKDHMYVEINNNLGSGFEIAELMCVVRPGSSDFEFTKTTDLGFEIHVGKYMKEIGVDLFGPGYRTTQRHTLDGFEITYIDKGLKTMNYIKYNMTALNGDKYSVNTRAYIFDGMCTFVLYTILNHRAVINEYDSDDDFGGFDREPLQYAQ